MKYNIEFKCGHTEEVELFGKFKDREREIERLKECNCSACRKLSFQKQMSAEYDDVRMSYNMNNNDNNYNNNSMQQTAGVRLIDAEDFAWQLASLTSHDVNVYTATHEASQLVPISLVLEMLDRAK